VAQTALEVGKVVVEIAHTRLRLATQLLEGALAPLEDHEQLLAASESIHPKNVASAPSPLRPRCTRAARLKPRASRTDAGFHPLDGRVRPGAKHLPEERTMTATCLEDEGSLRGRCAASRRALAAPAGLAALFAVAALACAAPGAPEAEAAGAARGLGRVVLTPLNLGLRTPPALRGSETRVWAELLRYLRAQDRSLSIVDAEDAEALWRDSVARLEPSDAPDEARAAASHFARLLAEYVDFDVVVMPSLVVRRARVGGRQAFWDGTRRPLPVREPLPIASDLDNGIQGVTLNGYKGSVAAASLYVAIVGSDGEPLYQGLAGLTVIQQLTRGARTRGAAEWILAPRGDAFADASGLRQGVERAFARRIATAR
jgi:hypothetical protein